jgi:GNAT superfamily N-acetyltransferase
MNVEVLDNTRIRSISGGALPIHYKFREANLEDQSKIVSFQIEMAMESESLRLDLKTCTLGVNAVFKNPHLGTYYVAEQDQEVIASLLVIPEWSDWRNGSVWWIHSVYVIPEARRNGVFSNFYEFIQRVGQVRDIRGLRLYVDKGNTSAQAVYKKLGMTNHHYDLYETMFKNG